MKLLLPHLFITVAFTSCQKEEITMKEELPTTYNVVLELKNTKGSIQLSTNNKDLNTVSNKLLGTCNNFTIPSIVSTEFKLIKGDHIVGFVDISNCDRNDQVFPKKAYLTITAGEKVIRDSIILTADKKYGTKVITME